MLETLFAPYTDVGLLILRVGLALVFVAHGWPKMKPGSAIGGPAGFIGFLRQQGVPLPLLLGWVVILLETVGAVLLVLGLGTRILALGYAIDMLVAIQLVKRRLMHAKFTGENGWELDFALMAGALALLFTGGGRLAVDPLIGL